MDIEIEIDIDIMYLLLPFLCSFTADGQTDD